MKRSDINKAFRSASQCFARNGWRLPPNAKWDVTDFGLGDFAGQGLVLINLAEEAEYCEKLMYAALNQATPLHYHKMKKEDIICRNGELSLCFWQNHPESGQTGTISIKVNGEKRSVTEGEAVVLFAGERVTIEPLMWHTFYPSSSECVIGEVSTANDDVNDNFFADPEIGRYPEIEEDAAPEIILLSERTSA